jgi:hypothetical protein
VTALRAAGMLAGADSIDDLDVLPRISSTC